MQRLALALVALVACGKSDRPVTENAAVRHDPEPTGDPTIAVVTRAFGTLPVLPALSADGATAAAEVGTPVGLTGASTYAVAFVSTTTERVEVVGHDAARALAEHRPIDEAAVARSAATVTARLRGFTPFEGKVDVPYHDTVAVGPVQLQTDEHEGTLVVTVLDKTGGTIAREVLEPRPMGRIGDIDCVSDPVPRTAHFDTKRKRVLLRIGWNAGPDQCDAPLAELRLWAVP